MTRLEACLTVLLGFAQRVAIPGKFIVWRGDDGAIHIWTPS